MAIRFIACLSPDIAAPFADLVVTSTRYRMNGRKTSRIPSSSHSAPDPAFSIVPLTTIGVSKGPIGV
jgi:hypothetical protein